MANFQNTIGETIRIATAVDELGAKPSLRNSRVVFKLMQNLSDPDNACLALLDNRNIGGVHTDSTNVAITTVPASATYGLADVQQTVFYEVWVNLTNTFAGPLARVDFGTVTLFPRGLVQQP